MLVAGWLWVRVDFGAGGKPEAARSTRGTSLSASIVVASEQVFAWVFFRIEKPRLNFFDTCGRKIFFWLYFSKDLGVFFHAPNLNLHVS